MKNIVKIFKCPSCCQSLRASGNDLTCESCDNAIPMVNGIPIFLSEQEAKDFFTNEYFDMYIDDEHKQTAKELLNSTDYLSSLNKLTAMIDEQSSQPSFMAWFDDIVEPDQELAEAIDKSVATLLDFSKIKNANLILDWPTGNGYFIRTAIKQMNDRAMIIAYDINFISLYRTKKYLENKGISDKVIFVIGDVRKMPFQDNSFDLVTAWGGTVEVPDADVACGESYRVLKPGGIFATDGSVYKEGSPSLEIAKTLNLHHLATEDKVLECFNQLGFKEIKTEIIYEGYDKDDLPDEERCPLPARGDWFGSIEIVARK